MYVIGLTGNVAAGKSTVARVLGRLGANIIDCDVVAHYLMEPGTVVWERILESFGEQILAGDTTIDRGKLGRIVFADPESLRRLEAISHPAVVQETERLLVRIADRYLGWVACTVGASATQRGDGPVVVLEAIKLVESGMHRRCDALWVVTCGREQQIRRLETERGLSRDEAETRIDAQTPIEEKIGLADLVLENDKTIRHLDQQIRKQWELIQLDLAN